MSAPAQACERCDKPSHSCRTLTQEESGVRVRDKGGEWRGFVACASCALVLIRQANRARAFEPRIALRGRGRARGRTVPRKEIAAMRDALGIGTDEEPRT